MTQQEIFNSLSPDARNTFLAKIPLSKRIEFMRVGKRKLPQKERDPASFYPQEKIDAMKIEAGKVLHYLTFESMTIPQIAKHLEITVNKARPILDRLCREGKIQRAGRKSSKKGGSLNVWTITPQSGESE